MYRFQLGLARVMKEKSSPNLQLDTKLNARCIEKIGQVAGKKKEGREER